MGSSRLADSAKLLVKPEVSSPKFPYLDLRNPVVHQTIDLDWEPMGANIHRKGRLFCSALCLKRLLSPTLKSLCSGKGLSGFEFSSF